MPRRASSWTRDDSLVVLASYLARPPRMTLPPPMERRRVADKLGVTVTAVTQRLWMFAELDPENPIAETGNAGLTEMALWRGLSGDPLRCFEKAERIIERRKTRPTVLYGKDRHLPLF